MAKTTKSKNTKNKEQVEEKDMEHIVSFSGGKDSTAMLIRMLELGMQVDRIVFADTKYEFEAMYEYIEKINKYIKKYGDYEVEVLRTTKELEDDMLGAITRGKRKGEVRGFPLTAFGCYWSRDAKVKELNKVCKGNHRYIGIAVDEKKRMAKDYKEKHYHYPLIEWGWTEQDCLEYLKEKDLHNPLYDEFGRLGCFWCPKQSIDSLRILFNNYPEHWEQMLEWDRQIKAKHKDRVFKPNKELADIDKMFRGEKEQKK